MVTSDELDRPLKTRLCSLKAGCCKLLTANDLWPNVQQGHVSSLGSSNVLNHPCTQMNQMSIRRHTQTHTYSHVPTDDMAAGSELSGIHVEWRWQQCVCVRVSVQRCVFEVSSVDVLPPQAASTLLAIQTLLSTKPLPDLSLCRDIWTLVNRSNSTKECWKNGKEMEEKKTKLREQSFPYTHFTAVAFWLLLLGWLIDWFLWEKRRAEERAERTLSYLCSALWMPLHIYPIL